MIQAPQLQYMPAQQPIQTGYPQQGAYNPVQYQQPQQPSGVIYNYPTTSSYMPAQSYSTDKSQYNGVNIEIINPQGQGMAPQNACQMPAQQQMMPAQYMPIQQPVMMPAYPTPFPTSQAIVNPPLQQPVMPQQPVQVAPMQPEVVPQAAPQVVPEPQIAQTPVQTPAAAPVVEQPAAPAATVNPESYATKLQTTDLDAQNAAIEEIAEAVKKDDVAGPILLDTQIFDALVDIINKDTSALEGPSPEVIELRQKPQEELTEEQKKQAATPSPFEKAEINKQHALYTISYMQERLNNELEKRNGTALALQDLPCIEQVIDTAKSNQNPMLRVSALASLSHIARPEYKEDLSKIFELAKSDEEPRVQEAATKAAESLNK